MESPQWQQCCAKVSHVWREGKAGCQIVEVALNNTATSKGAGHQLIQGATPHDLTTLVQTIVTFSISQLPSWSRNGEEGKPSLSKGSYTCDFISTRHRGGFPFDHALSFGAPNKGVCVQMVKHSDCYLRTSLMVNQCPSSFTLSYPPSVFLAYYKQLSSGYC